MLKALRDTGTKVPGVKGIERHWSKGPGVNKASNRWVGQIFLSLKFLYSSWSLAHETVHSNGSKKEFCLNHL